MNKSEMVGIGDGDGLAALPDGVAGSLGTFPRLGKVALLGVGSIGGNDT